MKSRDATMLRTTTSTAEASVAKPAVDAPRQSLASEQIILYPTFGHPTVDDRAWHVGVSGVVYEAGRNNLRRKMFVRVLQRLLRITSAELDEPLFQQRVDQFLVSTEKGRRVAVELGGQTHISQRPSKRNGHFRGSFCLSRDELRDLSDTTGPGPHRVRFQVAESTDNSASVGVAQLIESTGTSVISDIDDTIKESEVADRRRLLQNTFMREFMPVSGMSSLYQAWAAQGAAFHYVSSSPWQLYNCLAEFRHRCGFPEGSFHLRAIRLRDPSVLRLFIARRATKRRVIRSIVRMFPHRKFILVGDSGERDPEIYGAIARQFPGRVERILIRRVPGRAVDRERVRRAFRDLTPAIWQLFESPDELLSTTTADANPSIT